MKELIAVFYCILSFLLVLPKLHPDLKAPLSGRFAFFIMKGARGQQSKA